MNEIALGDRTRLLVNYVKFLRENRIDPESAIFLLMYFDAVITKKFIKRPDKILRYFHLIDTIYSGKEVIYGER